MMIFIENSQSQTKAELQWRFINRNTYSVTLGYNFYYSNYFKHIMYMYIIMMKQSYIAITNHIHTNSFTSMNQWKEVEQR